MGVGVGFLRPREDGTWEGDYVSVGWGTFGDFQNLVYSLPGGFYFISSWGNGDEYDMDLLSGTPPYPAWVSPELAEDLKKWLEYEAPGLLAALQGVQPEQVEEHLRWLKSLVEQRLAEGDAIVISY